MSSNTNTYKGIYAMHKYWGKKPFNEISKFIERYSAEGETVMDSFCGSGVTLIEALKANRKCVGVDLNPIAVKLARVSMTTVDPDRIDETFQTLKAKLQPVINSLYETEVDGAPALVTHTIWKNKEPLEVWYSTQDTRKKIRPGDDRDVQMAFYPALQPKWYPTSPMYENPRINIGKDRRVSDLFTPRALVGLSLILDEIRTIPDEKVREVFELAFSGTLSQASSLVFVIRDRKRKPGEPPKAEVGSWVIGYWMPEEHFEINVWNCFENRYKRVFRGELEIQELFGSREPDYYRENVTLVNGSATNLPVADNSVDYVFIDPPHADRILYMEQSFMWNSWLRLDRDLDWEEEIIVSGARDRKEKNAENFNQLLDEALGEVQRTLKPGRYLSLAFNCLDDDTWTDILSLTAKHGFRIAGIEPLEYSATSVVQDNRKNALKMDLVLTFLNAGDRDPGQISCRDGDDLLEDAIREVLAGHPDYQVYQVMNALLAQTIPLGYVFRVSHIVKKCAALLSEGDQ